MVKLSGRWFKGNFFSFSSDKMRKSLKYSVGVKKPTAIETKNIRGKIYSRFYHKPIYPGELD